MIIVTGATGALNGATVDHLLERLPAAEIAVVTRDTARAQRFADLGVSVRQGDYSEPAGLRAAFDGAEQLLLVSSNDPTGDTMAQHGAAVRAATEAGAGRILYTSHQGARLGSPFRPADDHARTEQLLAESGVPWTSLRNGFYLHSIAWLMGPWRETGVVRVPADGPVSWTSRDDEAEAAAEILLSEGGYDGPVTLTAAAAPTFEDLASIASETSGRDVRFELIDEDEWVAAQVAAGSPDQMARFLLGMYRAAAAGYFAETTPLLGELLRREPRSAREELTAPAAE